jgi:hypothetical protein
MRPPARPNIRANSSFTGDIPNQRMKEVGVYGFWSQLSSRVHNIHSGGRRLWREPTLGRMCTKVRKSSAKADQIY